VNLLRTYHSPLALSVDLNCAFCLMDRLRDVFFTELISRSTVNPTKVVTIRNFERTVDP